MKKLLLVLPFLAALLASPAYSQTDTGIYIGVNCTTLAPGDANSTLCLQISDSGTLDGGLLYRWDGSQWLNSNITDIVNDGSSLYAADTGSSDAYASCPATLLETGAYITGAFYFFKANTVNTDVAHWDGCGFGQKTIKKVSGGVITDLEDDDIPAGKIVMVQYDGTNWQMQSPAATVTGGGGAGTPGGSDTQVQFNDSDAFGGDSGLTFNKTSNVLTMLGGSVSGDITTNSLSHDTSAVTGAKTATWPNVSGTVSLLGASIEVAEAAAPLITKSITFRIGSDSGAALADTADETDMWRNNIAAMTITEVWCSTNTGTSTINLQRDDGSAADILSSNLVCTTGGATGTIAGAEDNVAAGDKIDFVMITAATSGAPTRVTVSIKATLD